uniref:G-patch domain-containing protein n=1 Tax=Fagus sylvatica TaxID=28930 RepID=A0A2N9IHW0_FAGSY
MLFHVLEITTYYNLLLGRAWMHPLGIVPSTVHQKLKLQWKGGVLTILGDGEISAPVCDIKINNDIQLQDFEVMKTSSVVIASIMKKMGYQLGMRLGKFNQGIKKLPKVYSQSAKEDFPYCGFIEPRGGKPRFEIFFKTQLTLEDKSSVEDKAPVEDKVDEDWMGQMDPKAMKMFVQERDVFHIEEELKEDHAAMIIPVSNYPINEMNLNFDYMHVSSGNEALNTEGILNDEHLINEEDEAKIKPIENETIKINLGSLENPKEVKIGSTLSSEEQEGLTKLLKEFPKVFAWSYEDMPGINYDIVQHRILTLLEVKPIKQKLHCMKPEWMLKIKEEVIKQLKAGFIKAVNQTNWVANVVPVPKEDGKVKMCIDFRDLNKACPKDDFPLPHIDVLVDNTAGSALMSLMDDFSGYNQILMAPENKTKTTFVIEWGIYCYTIMPFRLKNADTTGEHITNLRKFFERIKKYKLRLNPNKGTFRVIARKLLGHMVNSRGIEIDPIKIKAILEMPLPKMEKEIRGFIGRLQYISSFIARLTTTCEPIFKLLKKGEPKEWREDCEKAFKAVQRILFQPTSLGHHQKPRRVLNLYLSVIEDALGSMLA